MIWIAFILGIAVGAAGYYAYDKFFSKAEAAVKAEVVTLKKKL
jgi:hypothetical protein